MVNSEVVATIEPTNTLKESVACVPIQFNNFDRFDTDSKLHHDMKLALTSFLSTVNTLNVPEERKNTFYQCTNDLLESFSSFINGVMAQDSGYTHFEAVDLAKSYVCNQLKRYHSSYRRQKQAEHCATYVKPQEFAIGTHFEMKRPKEKNMAIPKLLQSKGHYIPVTETIRSLFKNESFRSLYLQYNDIESCDYRHTCEKDIYYGFCCGQVFKENELYTHFPNSLQIRIFTDDFTIANPLGPASTLHKLTAVYFSIQNLPPELLSKPDNIYVVALLHSDDIKTKETDYNDIWRMLVRDISNLEQFGIEIDGGYTIKGTISCLCFDNLGANASTGFSESFNAIFFCRICTLSKNECQTQCQEDRSKYRNMNNYQKHLFIIENSAKVNLTESYGVKRYCVLNDLAYFKTFINMSVDIMHDINEGVAPFLMHHFFNLIISSKILNEDTLLKKFQYFDYGRLNSKSVPALISLTKPNLNQTASQSLCLFQHLPFVLFELRYHVKLKETWECVKSLLKIIQIVYSNKVTENERKMLEEYVYKHLDLIQKVFNIKLIPKHHFLTHYATLILLMGPLIHMSTMRFESKHQELKELIKNSRNFMNVTHTITQKHQAQLTFKSDTYSNESKHGKKVPYHKIESKINACVKTFISNNFLSQDELFFVEWFSLNCYIYRKGLFIIHNQKFVQIEDIFIYNNEEYIVGTKWDCIEFDDFLNSLQIAKSESDETVFIKFMELEQKQLFEIKAIDHKFFIIADTLLVKPVI